MSEEREREEEYLHAEEECEREFVKTERIEDVVSVSSTVLKR